MTLAVGGTLNTNTTKMMMFCCLLIFFKKILSGNTIKVSKGLYPDQDRHDVGPDLGPNSLRRLSADDKKLPLANKELIKPSLLFTNIVGSLYF